MLYKTVYSSPLGSITILCDNTALKAVWLDGQAHTDPTLEESASQLPGHPILISTVTWLDQYFSGKQPDPQTLPLSPEGTAFRRRVWDILLKIPYGRSTTYGAIARQLGIGSARAVGAAVGQNPISIIIPCHRVLGANNTLTGYAGGIQRKKALLNLEHIPYL